MFVDKVLMQKLINSCGPIEDPSPVQADHWFLVKQNDYCHIKQPVSLIASSNCCFSNWDVDLQFSGTS